jgi:hypothetical protein
MTAQPLLVIHKFILNSTALLTMHFIDLLFLSAASLVTAWPQTCQSNAIEKIHEGHGHNINTGDVGTAHLGLKLPGGSGCYKGQKVDGLKISGLSAISPQPAS